WSPRTPHSLYLVSQDPAFTISGLPGPCIHYIRSSRTLHSLYPDSPDPAFTISGLPGPCIHYIRSPRTLHSLYLVSHSAHKMEMHPLKKKKKKNFQAIHTKPSMWSLPPRLCSISR
ncbi:unnamed protein product, partial [Staurois parvus]